MAEQDNIEMPANYLEEPYVPGPEPVVNDTPVEPELVFWCARDRTFYMQSVHGDAIPDDSLAMTQVFHQQLLNGLSNGLLIADDADGLPHLVDPMSDPAAALARAQGEAQAEFMQALDRYLAQFTAGVPAPEVASWSTKAAAALSHSNATPHPLIVSEAKMTGEDPDWLAQVILGKAEQYTGIISVVTGIRRSVHKHILAATDVTEVAAVLKNGLTALASLQSEDSTPPKPATKAHAEAPVETPVKGAL